MATFDKIGVSCEWRAGREYPAQAAKVREIVRLGNKLKYDPSISRHLTAETLLNLAQIAFFASHGLSPPI